MKKYWVMKTFQDWFRIFQLNNVIGIDEDSINDDYLNLNSEQINNLLEDNNNNFNEYHNRVFKEFCKWMQIGDFVIIGTGQVTTFNISGIVRVTSKYRFDSNFKPRYIRDIEFLKIFPNPLQMQKFKRTSRLELIDEEDFHDAIISLLM